MTQRPRPIPDLRKEPISSAITITALICLVIALVLTASKFVFQSSEDSLSEEQLLQIESGLEFPPLQIDKARLSQARDEFYETPDLSHLQDILQALHDLVRQANTSQFPVQDGEPGPPPSEVDHHLRLLADELLPAAGARGFATIGEPIFNNCSQGLSDLLSALQAQEIPLPQALEDPPAQHFSKYRENCGNVLPMLIERGLVSHDGDWVHDSGEELFDILQRYRWADLIHSRYPTNQQLSPYELELFSRWRIEDPLAFPPPERRRLLAQSRGYLPTDYDTRLAEVRIEAATQDLSTAALRLEDLVHENPKNPVYSAIFQDIEAKLGVEMP